MPLAGADHALEIVGAALDDGPPPRFDAGGVCQLTVQDLFVLSLQRMDDRRLRLLTYLDGVVQPMTARFLLNAMVENHRGGTGPHARFGLHEGLGVLALEEVLDCAAIEADALEDRVLDFVKLAAGWMLEVDRLFDSAHELESQVHALGAAMPEDEMADWRDFADAHMVKV